MRGLLVLLVAGVSLAHAQPGDTIVRAARETVMAMRSWVKTGATPPDVAR